MNTLERSIRDDPGSSSRAGTPRNFFTFGITDATHSRRSPETEIVDAVDPGGLAVGRLGGGSSAGVRSCLAALGFGGERGGGVACVPDLVGVSVAAGPDLDLHPIP